MCLTLVCDGGCQLLVGVVGGWHLAWFVFVWLWLHWRWLLQSYGSLFVVVGGGTGWHMTRLVVDVLYGLLWAVICCCLLMVGVVVVCCGCWWLLLLPLYVLLCVVDGRAFGTC